MLQNCFEYKSGAHSIENLLLNNKSLTQNKKTTNAILSYLINAIAVTQSTHRYYLCKDILILRAQK